MNYLDFILIAIAVIAVIKGLRDGFVRQAGSIAGLFLGIFLAGRFSAMLSQWLHQWVNAPENIVKIISFILIIIVVCLCMHLLGRLLEKILKIVMLGWLNRILGMAISLFAAVLIAGVLLSVIDYVNESWFTLISQDTLNSSKGVQIVSSVSDAVFPYIRDLFSA
ncbi:MAG TPA: CvpA family protein [Candidatus Coprenecus pullistercoris]|nr:CvpA family protein [Candidatus Coprenecus pullistercoris]